MYLYLTTKTSHLLELFFWMLGAFLIGYFFAWQYFKNKFQTKLEDNEETIVELKNEMQSTIRARKTVERGGIEIKQPKNLNFDVIGSANEENKDDLTLIKGIGEFIEKKLNQIGIYNLDQISKLDKENIDTITDLIQFFPGRIVRDDWKGQAKQLLNKENIKEEEPEE
ncbi:Predicted 5' DNA nuclease, flap endonuclease-1-like, helix-3-turn-helix (H3TH) domain [Tenacibaculum sp. 190524A02b]|uniref:Predicted 5' DNA nuclease, flap endonuclease-1-like, helix-3-turn-helix (H3TH) domain n=2 Tax=Tenacibaculum vairaonense TaxID=3137860 RepID=A0ABM9PP74_9FLAO